MTTGSIVCMDCGRQETRRSPSQRYCAECSARRDMVRKRVWARGHPPSSQQRQRNKEHEGRRKSAVREAGADANQRARRGITWPDPGSPDLLWLVRVAVPFSYAVSKNHIYTTRRSGHVALRQEAVAKRREIALVVRSALAARRVAHNKLWIDVLVQKPDHRGDAVNVVDLVCDAIKDATGLDDRWFCIRQLDWEIAKQKPMLYIGLGQESNDDCQVCSHCGRVQPLEAFPKRTSRRLGRDRVCRECGAAGRALARQRREGVA